MRSMNTYYKFLLLLAALFLFATCKKTNETIADFQLRVSGIVPDSGYSNTLVTIKGENFSLILAEDSVAFNGVPAKINLATDTTLQVYAPVAGTTGKVLVKVGENKSTGPVFTYVILPQQNPQITALSPSSALPFSTVTISGHNFSSIASLDNVQFGALKATVLRADTNSLQVQVPLPSVYTTGNVQVSASVGGKSSNQVSFQYLAYGPVISGINPANGTVGTQVTITGSNFFADTSQMVVYFNGTKAKIISAAATLLLVSAPAATSGNITVTDIPYNATANGPLFTYLPYPTITGISPSSGPAGTQVTLTGTNFLADTSKNTVYFNGLKAAIVSATTTKIVVIAPSGTTGNVSVAVNGLTGTGPVYTYTVLKPVITDVEYNNLFLVKGQNFSSTASVVELNGQTESGFSYSDYGNGTGALIKSSFTPSTNTNNPVQVTVIVSGVSSDPYTFFFPPQINSVTPDTVSYRETVVLQGILFGNRSAPSTVRAYYYDQNQNKVYMSPNPVIVSWDINRIVVTMPDYGSYPIGSGRQNFYLEVTVGNTSRSVVVYFHIT